MLAGCIPPIGNADGMDTAYRQCRRGVGDSGSLQGAGIAYRAPARTVAWQWDVCPRFCMCDYRCISFFAIPCHAVSSLPYLILYHDAHPERFHLIRFDSRHGINSLAGLDEHEYALDSPRNKHTAVEVSE